MERLKKGTCQMYSDVSNTCLVGDFAPDGCTSYAWRSSPYAAPIIWANGSPLRLNLLNRGSQMAPNGPNRIAHIDSKLVCGCVAWIYNIHWYSMIPYEAIEILVLADFLTLSDLRRPTLSLWHSPVASALPGTWASDTTVAPLVDGRLIEPYPQQCQFFMQWC